MKRFGFIASLLGLVGVARAQTAISAVDFDFAKKTGKKWAPWEGYPPKNNQCPVCGTMAEPYKTRTKVCNDPKGNVAYPEWPWCINPGDPNLTRCKRCNAAFWQDAV